MQPRESESERGDWSRGFGGHDGVIDGNTSREAWSQG